MNTVRQRGCRCLFAWVGDQATRVPLVGGVAGVKRPLAVAARASTTGNVEFFSECSVHRPGVCRLGRMLENTHWRSLAVRCEAFADAHCEAFADAHCTARLRRCSKSGVL